MPKRIDHAGTRKAAQVPGVWDAMYSRTSSWRDDGLVRGSVCGLLPLSASSNRARDGDRGVTAMAFDTRTGFACPIPIGQYAHVQLAHGGGGQLTSQLIEQMFVPAFNN